MRTHTRLLFVALAATALMITFVAGSSARKLSVSEREFEFKWENGLKFEAAGNNVDCPITLLGHFSERTIAKVAGQIGVIKHVAPSSSGSPPCTGGEMVFLTETLPWRVNYVGFSGTLPAIEDIRLSIVGLAFFIRLPSNTMCLIETTAAHPAFAELVVGRRTGRIEGIRADETRGIPISSGFVCGLVGEGRFSGTGTVTNLPGTASITVTLI